MMNTPFPKLDNRLKQALLLADPGKTAADIGADHGQLSAALLMSGYAEHVLVSDISEPSLNKARTALGNLGIYDKATFAVADGLDALKALRGTPADNIFILGMGGMTLSQILEKGAHRLQGAALILGAQTDLPLLRETLQNIGYRIRKEIVVEENRRYYILMQCTPAHPDEPTYTRQELLLGPVLLQEYPPLWPAILNRRRQMLETAVTSMQKATSDKRAAQLPEFEEELSYVNDALSHYSTQG